MNLSKIQDDSTMQRLWAPWRLDYITAAASLPPEPKPASECFICHGLAASNDKVHLIAYRTPHSVVLLNKYPYNNGHLLVAPLTHSATLEELNDTVLLDLQHTVRQMMQHIDKIMKPDGYNVGLNLGRVAGAGLPGHLHWHIVPRWNGDTNFMPVLGQTKVISQSLEAFYELLVGAVKSPRV
ncbi:MAG TPA: HIT domain-containing protein [Gemmatales bacterium]|nr:HIT domain-containing protein [Gemmatales bacterium]